MAALNGAVWLLSRVVEGDAGERYTQNVSVYAASANEAKSLVRAEFARLRRFSGARQMPYQATPEWSIEKVALDEPKLITAGITPSTAATPRWHCS